MAKFLCHATAHSNIPEKKTFKENIRQLRLHGNHPFRCEIRDEEVVDSPSQITPIL